ncbi:hydrogenase expression/formation protein HypE [Candidatus Magnetomoraceae bacterium gMMP-13]
MNNKAFHVKAVLFDFDGTLTKPGSLDFSTIKSELGCPFDIPVLEFIKNIPDSEQRKKAFSELDHFEVNGAVNSKPNPGAEELISYLRSKGLAIGIITRNTLKSIKIAFKNFKSISIDDFDLIISRNDPVDTKPSPDGIFFAAKKFDIDINQLVVVGDYIIDIQAGKKAGAITVLLDNNNESDPLMPESDYKISFLKELKKIIRLGLPLPAGKFPNDLLEEFLTDCNFNDPSVLICPRVGEDTAAVSVDKEEILILKSDPITFATDSIADYAVLVNANDIATSGADPRWLLTTILFPCGITASESLHIINQLKEVCRKWNITLCGGHTEITDAVTRQVIIGMLAGTVSKKGLIDKSRMKQGDKVLLTKGIAVEGTAIIAREFSEKLKYLGMSEKKIKECSDFLCHISIINEAKIAISSGGITAMHDVTEGGLATALSEFSIAGKHNIRINMEKISIFPQTQKICQLLDINPLGLIGSGSLLISCKPDYAEKIINNLHNANIKAACIGEVVNKGREVKAMKEGRQVEWPSFEVDEITKLFYNT